MSSASWGLRPPDPYGGFAPGPHWELSYPKPVLWSPKILKLYYAGYVLLSVCLIVTILRDEHVSGADTERSGQKIG